MKNQVKKLVGIAALSAAMTIGAAGGIAYSHMTHADLVKAETANYYAEESHVFSGTGTLTQTKSETFTLTGVKAGQYSVTVEITKTEGESQEWFYLSATGLDDAVFLNESTETPGKYYGVVNVGAGGTLTISSTSPNTLYVNVTLDNLFMSEDSGYSLGNVHFAKSFSPISIDFSGTNVSDFTVQVDLGDRLLKDGETLTARIGDVTKPLVAQTDNLAIYSATLTETDVTEKKLTITSTIVEAEDESVIGSVTLLPLSNVYTMTTNTATAENVPVWETAIFSYTPQAEGTEEEPIKTFYKSVAISTAEGVSIETDTTVSLTAGTFNGTTIVDENYPIYVEAGTTYYFEVTLTGITPGTLENANITITISDWKAPEEISIGTYAMPVTPAEEVSTEFNHTGVFNLTITDIPFNYYWAETPIVITAHIGTQAIALTRENNYSAEKVAITAGDKVYFTTSENARTTLTFSFEVYQEVHYIVPGEKTTITVPAGSVTYFIEGAEAGVYSIDLTDASSSVSVMVGDVTIVPAGKTMGGFVVQYEGNDFGITFVNDSATDVEIEAEVNAEDRDATIQLNTPKSITLNAAQRQAFFMYSLAAGTFELTVNPEESYSVEGITLTVDGEPITLTDGKATITITNVQDANGLVNFTFENTSAGEVKFNVTVKPDESSILELNKSVTINTVDYEYRTTYYAMVTKGETYAVSLVLPEGMSVIVTQNGEELVNYGGMAGAFIAESDGYVTLRFTCYTYGDKTQLTAYFNNAGEMPINKEVEVTVNTDNKMYSYVTYLYSGTYHINVDNENVKIAVNGVEIEGNSFVVYDYSKVTITFIYDGEGTFNATLVTNMLTLKVESEITLTAYQSESYYIDLTSGDYVITLTFNDGSQIQVALDGTIINISNNSAAFAITTNGYHALTFTNFTEADVTFSVVVTVLE